MVEVAQCLKRNLFYCHCLMGESTLEWKVKLSEDGFYD